MSALYFRQIGQLLIVALTVSGASLCSAANGAPTAAKLGLVLNANRNALVVVHAASGAAFGLRTGDQIVAVNGRKVATEAAFLNRLSSNGNGAASVIFIRNGQTQVVNSAALAAAPAQSNGGQAAKPQAGAGGGILNPNFMVRTPLGIMHRDVAARLGLPATPLEGGSPDPRPRH